MADFPTGLATPGPIGVSTDGQIPRQEPIWRWVLSG